MYGWETRVVYVCIRINIFVKDLSHLLFQECDKKWHGGSFVATPSTPQSYVVFHASMCLLYLDLLFSGQWGCEGDTLEVVWKW